MGAIDQKQHKNLVLFLKNEKRTNVKKKTGYVEIHALYFFLTEKSLRIVGGDGYE